MILLRLWNFGSWVDCILHFKMAMRFWGPGAELSWFKVMCLGVKRTSGRLVMVNFDYQLDWINKYARY